MSNGQYCRAILHLIEKHVRKGNGVVTETTVDSEKGRKVTGFQVHLEHADPAKAREFGDMCARLKGTDPKGHVKVSNEFPDDSLPVRVEIVQGDAGHRLTFACPKGRDGTECYNRMNGLRRRD